MSAETSIWLNQNVLVGFTDKRGHAWHYRAADQGDESNHYPGAVPVEDVKRRLFHWQAVPGTVETTIMTPDGVTHITDPTRKTIVRPDTGKILGVFREGYEPHQYDEWLLKTVGTILDDDLSIGSAGLLKDGAVAWVSVEVPDSITTPEGVTFRPNLLATTSFDGSSATTFKRVVTLVVCDNTRAAALSENGQVFKARHSRYSGMKIGDARKALGVIHSAGDDFEAEVKALCETAVSDPQWAKFKDLYVPVPESAGRAQTIAVNKRDALENLYRNDNRVAPWAGTAWGVAQAVNTYGQHIQTVRGAQRSERNMLRTINGDIDKEDANALVVLSKALAD